MQSIRCFGDSILFTPTEHVAFPPQKNLQDIIEKMMAIATEQGGVGLASNQCATISAPAPSIVIVGYAGEEALAKAQKRYPNMNIPKATILINPHIIERSPETYFPITGEGCISIPSFFRGKVIRHRWVAVRYQDIEGKFHEEVFTELRAHIVQHEIDHLQGIVFMQRLIQDMSISQRQQFGDLLAEIIDSPNTESEPPQVPTLVIDRDRQGHPVINSELLKLTLSGLDTEILKSLKESTEDQLR